MHPPRFHDDPRPSRSERPRDSRSEADAGASRPAAVRSGFALTPSEERALRSFTTDPSFGPAAAPLGTDDEAAGVTPTTIRPHPPVFTPTSPEAGDPLTPFLSGEDPRAGTRLHPTWAMWSLIVLAMAAGAAVLTALAI
ncbi:hypothetical protein [Roseixanthobacter pseudopolyaromaticivorans]|uniref:hypothetical protein n=1 Tax=Xanthobacteraceae TaxID=335928 RepID=UPI00372BE425